MKRFKDVKISFIYVVSSPYLLFVSNTPSSCCNVTTLFRPIQIQIKKCFAICHCYFPHRASCCAQILYNKYENNSKLQEQLGNFLNYCIISKSNVGPSEHKAKVQIKHAKIVLKKRGMTGKVNELRVRIGTCDWDVMVIAETSLKKEQVWQINVKSG